MSGDVFQERSRLRELSPDVEVHSSDGGASSSGPSADSVLTIHLSDLSSDERPPEKWLPKHLHQQKMNQKKAGTEGSAIPVPTPPARKKDRSESSTGRDLATGTSASSSGKDPGTGTSQCDDLAPVRLEDGTSRSDHTSTDDSLPALPPDVTLQGGNPAAQETSGFRHKAQDITKLLPFIPKDHGVLTSIGSRHHASGMCNPCGFMFSKLGCQTGALCEWCHFKHKRRRKYVRKMQELRLSQGIFPNKAREVEVLLWDKGSASSNLTTGSSLAIPEPDAGQLMPYGFSEDPMAMEETSTLHGLSQSKPASKPSRKTQAGRDVARRPPKMPSHPSIPSWVGPRPRPLPSSASAPGLSAGPLPFSNTTTGLSGESWLLPANASPAGTSAGSQPVVKSPGSKPRSKTILRL